MAKTAALTDKQRTPPRSAGAAAERGLRLREKHGRGGTDVDVRRAHQLSEGKPMSEADIKQIHSYFARHSVDKSGEGWASRTDPSAGYIAWLLWGGDPGKHWADRMRAKLGDS